MFLHLIVPELSNLFDANMTKSYYSQVKSDIKLYLFIYLTIKIHFLNRIKLMLMSISVKNSNRVISSQINNCPLLELYFIIKLTSLRTIDFSDGKRFR